MTNIKTIKEYFNQQNNDSYYFVSASNFNLMFVHKWVNNWFNVNLIDSYNSNNSSVLLPKYKTMPLFEDIEQINTFLLGNKIITEHIKKQQTNTNTNAMFLFYNQELEEIVKSLSMVKIMPESDLVKNIDNKITTTQIGNKAGVASVPNALVEIKSYQQLQEISKKHNLSDKMVVQTAFGDSGKTTFFINNEKDYQKFAEKINQEKQVKVMKNINCTQIAIEAVATKNGTFIGPILSEIIGEPELTPYAGGWCGNDIGNGFLDENTQTIIYANTQKLGQELYARGYKGYFEVDYLLDKDDANCVYLGEINPRITGISALTNMSSFCQNNIPLFLLHLLEFGNQPWQLNATEFNQLSRNFQHPAFGQLIFKCLHQEIKILTDIPRTGVYTYQDSKLKFIRYEDDATTLKTGEIYLLQILQQGEYSYYGADLLILFTGEILKDESGNLTKVANSLLKTVNNAVIYQELTSEEKQTIERYGQKSPIKTSDDSE